MFVQYSFVERRSRPDMRSEPIRLGNTAVIAIGIAFMAVTSLGYALTAGA